MYIIVFALLLAMELVFFKIADKYNIIDKPNHRSAHTEITLRGGGIIFWFVALLYFAQHYQDNYLFFIGITLVSLVSFWDDIQSLSSKLRFFTHFLAITIVFYHLNIFIQLPFYGVFIVYFLSIGFINAYNFMDGINGITGVYTLSVLGSLVYVNEYVVNFIDLDFIIYPMIASFVFLIFNFRKKAKCFAGDIGSIAIAFWIVFLLLKLYFKTDSFIWIALIAVYGADTTCTILHRLYLKQKISEAHRLHFYQILCNEYKLDHRLVAIIYALVQVAISCIVFCFYSKYSDFLLISVIFALLTALYSIKFYLLKTLKQ